MKGLYYRFGSYWSQFNKRIPVGRNIYDTDWDLCLVLDSTRLDMLRELLPSRIEQEATVRGVWSSGSITTEWLSNTFRREHAASIDRTGLVSATPHTQTVFRDKHWLTNQSDVDIEYPASPAVDPSDFAGFHEVWRTEATHQSAVPATTMLDATLEACEEYERVVAHWMQPHEPFIAENARIVGGGPTEKNVWRDLKEGNISKADVWQSYSANLSYALEHVATLLSNYDGTVLLTSDHGNAMGEWGVYGHPFGWPQPEVRRVPWVELQAHDVGDHEPQSILSNTERNVDVESQLEALGYV